MKKKIAGMVSASILGTILVVIVIISLTSVIPMTKHINQDPLNHNSTNHVLPHPHNSTNYIVTDLNSTNSIKSTKWIQVNENIEGSVETIYIPTDYYLFDVDYYLNEQKEITGKNIYLNPMLSDFYHQVGFFDKPADAVVVYPIFTQAAYGQNGFYDYYDKKCDSRCLTVDIHIKIKLDYPTSGSVYTILKLLHYDTITDIDIDKNPNILEKYKKVIMLHNEYVTQREFDAVTNHPNVVYLFPNALYAKIQSDYDKNTITLIRGHGYPDSNIANGFDWKFDNSKFEYDIQCNNWNFTTIDNGKMLDCYPTFKIYFGKELLNEIKN